MYSPYFGIPQRIFQGVHSRPGDMAERNSDSRKSLETLSAELKEQLAASVPWRGLVVWRNPLHGAISKIKPNGEDLIGGLTSFQSYQS